MLPAEEVPHAHAHAHTQGPARYGPSASPPYPASGGFRITPPRAAEVSSGPSDPQATYLRSQLGATFTRLLPHLLPALPLMPPTPTLQLLALCTQQYLLVQQQKQKQQQLKAGALSQTVSQGVEPAPTHSSTSTMLQPALVWLPQPAAGVDTAATAAPGRRVSWPTSRAPT